MPAREAFKIRSPDLRDPESGDQNPGTKTQNPENPRFWTKIYEIRVCLPQSGAKIEFPTPCNHSNPSKPEKSRENIANLDFGGQEGSDH